jgi:hypothetical protein
MLFDGTEVTALGTVAGIAILATIVEGLVEYLVAPLVEKLRKPAEDETATDLRIMLLRYISVALGIVLCVVYNANLLSLLGVTTGIPFVGNVLTGLLIGRGSNYVHDFASRWLAKPSS